MFGFGKKQKLEKPKKLQKSGPIGLALSASMVVSAGTVAVTTIAAAGPVLLAISMAGTAIGAVVRFTRDLDDYAVSKHISGNGGFFTRLIYTGLKKTPLRVYTINQLSKRIETIQVQDEENHAGRLKKEAEKQRKIAVKTRQETTDPIDDDAPKTAEQLRDARTIRFITEASDHRKHLRHIMTAFLGIFAGLRLLSGLTNAKQHLTALQIASRVGGYIFGMGYSAGQIDAYIQRRAAEPLPRPFFRIANKWARNILPIRAIGDWLIKRDYENIAALERGDQVWRWRFSKAIAEKVPVGFARNLWLNRLEERKMQITPAVTAALEEKGVVERIDRLKAIVAKQFDEVAVPKIRVRAAYSELIQHTDDTIGSIREQYAAYVDKIAKRNAVAIQQDQVVATPALPLSPVIEDPRCSTDRIEPPISTRVVAPVRVDRARLHSSQERDVS